MSGSIPQRPWRRAAVLARAGARSAWTARGGRAGPDERREAAEQLVRALGRLRGTALKVAQGLSLETDLLPPELVDSLRRACSDGPPMDWGRVHPVLEQDLGPRATERFAALDRRAFAAASLGQVHAARGPDGEELAVKIQYPGLRSSIRDDLSVLRRVAALLPDSGFLLDALGEFELRLDEELDYRRERRMTERFGRELRVPGVRVPRVFGSLCGARVLSLERLPGLHLRAWLARRPTREEIDRSAQRVYDVLTSSLHGSGLVHADPNPGNFLFEGGGRVGLIDFGCVRRFEPEAVQGRVTILRSILAGAEGPLLDAYRGLGVLPAVDRRTAARLRARRLLALEDWLVRPLRAEAFDFGAPTGYCAEGRRLFAELSSDRSEARLPRTFIYLERTQYGLYRLFEELGARVDTRAMLG